MIERVFTATIPNTISAAPEVAPFVSGPIDFTGAMNPANIYLFGAHGGFIFEWKGPETYEVHTMTLASGRGAWVFRAARQALAMMADAGAAHIWARVHPDRDDIKALAVATGLRFACTHSHDGVDWRIYNWRTECPQR